MSYLTHLECSHCAARYDADRLIRLCPACASPLLARYDLERARQEIDRDALRRRPATMWRYRELLPVRDPAHIISLGEGGCPVLRLGRLGDRLGLERLYVKDEGQNPTGSFKALGLSAAVSRAVELGARELVIPTAGNAGGALAAYAARAGVPAHVFMPKDAPEVNQQEVRRAGADLRLVAGLIDEAGRQAAEAAAGAGWFDVSTLKEPYRLEGKKIMGYELAAHFGGRLPDVILYPTGGGTGLVGMWKAFAEMEALGWIDSRRPRMVAVQAAGCAPVVRAFHAGALETEPWPDAATIAGGLRVPVTIGGRLMIRALRESNGTGVTVSDEEIVRARRTLAHTEGMLVCLEAAATVAGLEKLVRAGWLLPEEQVVIFSTGSGLKDPAGV